MTEPIHLTEANFAQEVLESDQPVLVDFWASWCGPCKMLGPVIEKLAAEYSGKAKITKLSTEEHPNVAREYGISAIPTVIIFNDGKIVEEMVGVRNKSDYRAALDRLLRP